MSEQQVVPSASSAGVNGRAYRRFWKRIIDVVVSAAALLLFVPAMVLIAVTNLLCYRQVLFTEGRVGRDGKPFKMRKFMTILPGTELPTRFGVFLRHTALDELPQFYHVLIGEMSLVGPRPHTAEQSERLSQEFGERYTLRQTMRPGMTGVSQLRGVYDTDGKRAELVSCDADYVSRCTFSVDLVILLRTPLVVVTGH